MRSDVTADTLLGGRVRYAQPRDGYRVSLEAPLLARFAIDGRQRMFRHVVDLGAGPGAIALMLVVTGWCERATLVEPDVRHAELAHQNVEKNGVADRVRVVVADVEDAGSHAIEPAALVISNPPYFEPDRGAISSVASRVRARALVDTGVDRFIYAGRKLLGRDGRFVLAFPVDRLAVLMPMLRARGLHAKRLRVVHPRIDEEGDVVLIEALPGRAGGLVVQPPLAIRETGAGDRRERYTDEARAALWGEWPGREARSATLRLDRSTLGATTTGGSAAAEEVPESSTERGAKPAPA